MTDRSAKVPAAAHTLRILSLLAAIDVPVSAARIRAELGLPRSTTYQLLGVLEEHGFVARVPGAHTFGLGAAAYAMSGAYATQQPLVRAAAPMVRKLAASVRGSGHLARLTGAEVEYLLEERAEGAVSLITERGVRLSAAHTASGRALLAVLDRPQLKAVASQAGWRFHPLEQALAGTRKEGFAREVEEVSPGQESLAVAFADHQGRPSAALAVTYRTGTLDETERRRAVAALGNSAERLRRRFFRVGVE